MKTKKYQLVNWLKCIAALLIINSHYEGAIYPDSLSALSFGGFFGNMLFFLISGYCLANIKLRFPEWFAKRIIKVYIPYLLFLPFIINDVGFGAYFDKYPNWYVIFPIEPYHFIPTIVLAYPIFYLCAYINKNTKIKYMMITGLLCALQLSYYFLMSDYSTINIFAHFKPIGVLAYIISMVLGGWIRERGKFRKTVLYAAGMALFFAAYAGMTFIHVATVFKIAQLYIGLGFVFCLTLFAVSIEKKLKPIRSLDSISEMTLEIYLTQFIAIGAFQHTAFPSNAILCVFGILGIAYALNLVSRYINDKVSKFIIGNTQ